MKQLIGSDVGGYTFNATAGTITFTGGVAPSLEQILLVTDQTTGAIIYAPGTPATMNGGVLTLSNTSALSNTDSLQIYVDLAVGNGLNVVGDPMTEIVMQTGAVDLSGNAQPLYVDGEGNLYVNAGLNYDNSGNVNVNINGSGSITTKLSGTFGTATWNSATALNTTVSMSIGAVGNSVMVELLVTGSISAGVVAFLPGSPAQAPSTPFTARRVDQPYTNVTSVNLALLTPGTVYVYLVDVGMYPGFVACLTTAIVGSGSLNVGTQMGPAATSQLSAVGQTDATQLHMTEVNSASTLSALNTIASAVDTFGSPAETAITTNTEYWGGIFVSPAVTSALGSETAPVVRPVNRKVAVPSNSSTTVLGINAVFTGTWIDTTITGGNFVEVSCYPGAQAGNFKIQGTDDTTNTNMFFTLTQVNYSTSGLAASGVTRVNQRYWRVVYTNGAVAQTVFDLQAVEMSVPAQMGVVGDGSSFGAINSSGVTTQNAVPCTLAAGVASGDAGGVNLMIAGNGTGCGLGVGNSIYNNSSWDRERAVNGLTAQGSPSGVQAMAEVPTTSVNQASLVTGQSALTVANVKNAAGNLFGLFVVNPNASVIYIQFYNTASTPVLGTSVVWWVPIAASYCGPVQLPYAINFTTGIGIGAATTATGGSAPATAPIVTEFYI